MRSLNSITFALLIMLFITSNQTSSNNNSQLNSDDRLHKFAILKEENDKNIRTPHPTSHSLSPELKKYQDEIYQRIVRNGINADQVKLNLANLEKERED